jgi:para-nitrobenzyl esterase
MFWIHGGGWREFSGTAPGFDGSNLAASQDVVVITVNHRLNAFGFLRLDSTDERFADSGNAGLLDIVAALEWVRDNAEAFGGDPTNVTLFGESGGASKIAALMSMRRAKGLFHKAVVQSSGGGMTLASPEESARVAKSMAKSLGRGRLDPDYMQALPMADILGAMRSAPGPYRGMIDDRTLHGDPFGVNGPATSADIPLLIGCTNTETTYHLRNDPRNFRLDLSDVRRRLTRFLNAGEAMTDRVIRDYQAAGTESDPSSLMITITTDYIFKRNTYRIAALQAASARVPVYAYLFEWETPVEGGRLRSPHTSEVPFVFGTLSEASDCVGTGSELAGLRDTMMSVWATFARKGNPNIPAIPQWKPYDGDGQKMMIFNVESRFEKDPGAAKRALLDELPYFSYHNPIPALAAG